MQRQSQFWKLCRGKSSAEVNWSVQPELLSKDHKYKPVLISCASMKMYSHGGFGRISGCTLQFTSAELLPLQDFQNWDCRWRWAYSFGIGEVLWLISSSHLALSVHFCCMCSWSKPVFFLCQDPRDWPRPSGPLLGSCCCWYQAVTWVKNKLPHAWYRRGAETGFQ